MELEKALFRIHERILSQDNAQQIVRIIKIGFTVLGVSLLSIFLYANAVHRNSLGCIGNIYEDFKSNHLRINKIYILNQQLICSIKKQNFTKNTLQLIENQIPLILIFIQYYYSKGNKSLANDTVIFINVCRYNKTLQPEPMSYYNYTFNFTLHYEDKNATNSTIDNDQQNNNTNSTSGDNQNLNNTNSTSGDNQNKNNTDSTSGENKEKNDNNQNPKEKETDKPDSIKTLPPFIHPNKKQLRSHCIEQPKLQMEQAAVLQSLTYPKELRVERNITTAVMYVEPACYASNLFLDKIIFSIIGIEPIVINEMITSFKQNLIPNEATTYNELHIKNIDTDEGWSWSPQQIISYENNDISEWVKKSFFSVFRINLGLFYTSAVSALYIKISIICSPVFILLIMYCARCLGSQDVNVMTLIQTFPYLGLYLHALRGQKSTELVKSFLKMMLVIYFVYLSALFVGSFILFYKSIPKGLDENFLALLAILELLIMLFLRTRSSLKWFPRVSILLMSAFLFYTQNTIYGYYSILLVVIIFLILGFFCYILEEFEIPGVSWNESYHYTPSTHRPRCLYFPIFNLGWYYDLPQLWTMFYPLYGRDHFTQAQLSLVDKNAERGNNNDLGILMDFPQNNNRNNNQDNNNGDGNAGAADQNQNPNPVIQNNPSELASDIEMQNQNQNLGQGIEQEDTVERLQMRPSNQQQSDDLFGDDNQNRSREQHLLSNEERGKFYSGRGVQIGGSVSNAQSRQLNDNNKHQADKGEYQKLE